LKLFRGFISKSTSSDAKAHAEEGFVKPAPVLTALAEAVGETGQERRNPLISRMRIGR